MISKETFKNNDVYQRIEHGNSGKNRNRITQHLFWNNATIIGASCLSSGEKCKINKQGGNNKLNGDWKIS